MGKQCELCDLPARMFCESDQASLCWECDAKVHGANFLVARHCRRLLCRSCQAPTPWRASGCRLGYTVSVCFKCQGDNATEASDCCESTRYVAGEEAGERRSRESMERVTERSIDTEEEEEEGDSEEEEEDEEEEEYEEEEDGDNQVVPWSTEEEATAPASPPPSASCSSSDESSTSRAAFYYKLLKRRREEDQDMPSNHDDAGSSSSNQSRVRLPAAAAATTAAFPGRGWRKTT